MKEYKIFLGIIALEIPGKDLIIKERKPFAQKTYMYTVNN